MLKTDSGCSIVSCVCSVVCTLIKCLPVEIAIVALQASFLFHQAWASTALLNPIPANTWSLDKRPNAACTSAWYLLFSLQIPNLAAISLKNPLLHGSIADPNTKRSHTFSAGNHAEPAGTFHHLSFHFELEMGLCCVFQAAGVGNTFGVLSGKPLTVISISRRHCPGIQSSRLKWKNAISCEQFWSNCTWLFEIAG